MKIDRDEVNEIGEFIEGNNNNNKCAGCRLFFSPFLKRVLTRNTMRISVRFLFEP